SPPQPRIEALHAWLEHARKLGANALYLGPVFESSSHGYDTADYFLVDRRLGRNEDLVRFCRAAHDAGVRVIFDAVFNHVGRAFWAFKDLLAKGKDSAHTSWFRGVDFSRRSPHGDPFAYEGWNGHYSLVKLDVANPAVKEHLFAAVSRWVEEFGIDGLRLDAADCIDMGFLRELASFSHRAWPGFWLLGEVIHGDYGRWANPSTLDSVTNYECYKGLYSSHVDDNFFEIAYAQLHVAARQIAFLRRSPRESVLVVVNAGPQPLTLDCDAPGLPDGPAVDLLEPDRSFIASNGKIRVEKVPARWARILSAASRP
ncbi:MAG TPA: alpha-amylase family glycosyl hydrolase, partial [Spirochaetia bacterium]|nr:alpha-amylase family glycosyl hydrolase [Spirochaetia bacterium]